MAQTQVSVLSQPSPEVKENDDQEDREKLEHLEAQWSAAAAESSTVVQRKEAQLRLVTAFAGHTEAARATLERLERELEAGRL